MRSEWLRRGLGAGALCVLLAFPSIPAKALSLADVSSFDSGNGLLTFSNFDVTATGSLADLDLSGVAIVLTDSGFGFELVGGLSAFDGEIGDLVVRFDVGADIDMLDYHLSFNGAASEAGAGASVTTTFDGRAEQAFVFATGAGGLQLVDWVDFAASTRHLRATVDILLDSDTISGRPGSAVISVVTHEFSLIPEPATGALFLLSLFGVVLLRRLV
jgi:hypothetical protein